jgi:hypothetical protein
MDETATSLPEKCQRNGEDGTARLCQHVAH